MRRAGRTKTATSNGLVRRRPGARLEPRSARRPRPVGAGVAVTAIVLLLRPLRLLESLSGRLRLRVLGLELVGLLLRRQLAGQDVLEALAHLSVEAGRRQDVDVVAERAGRPGRLGE